MVRSRFAPSPTGDLHIGSARTALYVYLFTRREKGCYVLRIEDTDRTRSTEEAQRNIFEGLSWLGLTSDEGPYYQTQRFARYQTVIQEWLETGKAYRCYCSMERLTLLREQQLANKQKPRYDGCCRDNQVELPVIDADRPYVVRFKNPKTGHVSFDDLVFGKISFNNEELDDLIIARADGTPTYNFTVVIDDYDMRISHVIRGNDHLNNTPRQINMFHALAATPPQYAHLPMIVDETGKKLSKRKYAASVLAFRDEGILPAALLNYLLRLGWGMGDQEIFSLEEMCQYFDVTQVSRSPATYDWNKLLWLNQHYIKNSAAQDLIDQVQWHLQALGVQVEAQETLSDLIVLYQARAKTLKQMAEAFLPFFCASLDYPAAELEAFVGTAKLAWFEYLHSALCALPAWDVTAIKSIVENLGQHFTIPLKNYGPAVRFALLGTKQSPALDQVIFVLGKDKTLQRLQASMTLFAAP